MLRSLLVLSLVLLALGCGRTRTPPPSIPDDASTDASDAADSSVDARPDTAADTGPGECNPLGPAACLVAGCVPTYDDSCCPICTPTGVCADCSDPDFFVCRSVEDACMAAFCSFPAPGTCDGTPLDCASAVPFDEDSCSRPGCVPAVAPIGAPELPPTCVPITAGSCTALCFIEPPPCPEGTVAEADGSCFTSRCIPAGVCG